MWDIQVNACATRQAKEKVHASNGASQMLMLLKGARALGPWSSIAAR